MPPATEDLAPALFKGDRRALARAITLIESTRADHRGQAEALIERALPKSGKSVRIGITGTPGVGKSTFIEAFGLHLIGLGRKVAVLAVDPSSKRGGGSILGDKTRMPRLSVSPGAFIRPSPSAGTLGGVNRRTRESMLLCEAAGFDTLIVETVGVGQSETDVADMVDIFLLLLAPAGGDDLQGIKKGIVELADVIIINKADGDLKPAASRAVADYRNALRLIRPPAPDWTAEVLPISAQEGQGIAEVWQTVLRYAAIMSGNGAHAARRSAQSRAALWREIGDGLLDAFKGDAATAARLGEVEADVAKGKTSPPVAARGLLQAFLGK